MAYNFTAQWFKGAKAADALSRHPHHSPNQGDNLHEYEIDASDDQITTNQALSVAEMRTSTLNQVEQ